MRPENRDNLFGGRLRFAGSADEWTPSTHAESDPDDSPVEALIDAYFDGDISADDRIRLFELLRHDPDRCLQFVEMQRTALLLERAPAGPDQTGAILDRLGAPSAQRLPARSQRRAGPLRSHTRLAIAAAVVLGSAGLVILGQSGSQPRNQPASHTAPAHSTTERQATATAPSTSPDAHAPASTGAPSRQALQFGRLQTVPNGQFRDASPPEAPLRGLAAVTSGDADSFPLGAQPTWTMPRGGEGFAASPEEVRRLILLGYGGNTPWRFMPPLTHPVTPHFLAPFDETWAPPQPSPTTPHYVR